MKRVAAGLLTVAVMGLLLRSGSWRAPARPPTVQDDPVATEDGPESRVRALLECAQRADVDGYLIGFIGPLRARLERDVSEQGRDAFAAALRQAAAARKSHAVFAAEQTGPDAATVAVESVYPDRNERQTFRLERDTADGWRVAAVTTVRAHEPTARFGTSATFDGPDGVPVAVERRAPDEAPSPTPSRLPQE